MVWNKVKISNFLSERKNRFKPDEANKLGLQRIQKINFSGKIFLLEKTTNTNMILVKTGDLVISGINVEKGALAVYDGEEDILATIHYSSYEYDKTKINLDYLKWFLKSNLFKDILIEQTGSGIKTELKPKNFLPLEINLPDLDTQIEIKNKILAIEEEVQEVEDKIDEQSFYVKKLRESILQEAVQGKLVLQNSRDESAEILFEKIKKEKEQLIKNKKIKKEKALPVISDDEIPYVLPYGWKWCRLGDVCNYGSTKKIESNEIDKNTWLLDLEDIEKTTSKLLCKKKFSEKPSLSSKNIFEKNDVLYSKLRPYLDKVLLAEDSGVCTSEILPLRGHFGLEPKYLRFYLKNPCFLNYVSELTYGVKMPRLGTIDGRNALFPLPPLEEQKRIVEKIDSLMSFCDSLESEVIASKKSAEDLMQAVLREAFSEK
jgi:type I restriction enzyme S subunit